MERADSTLKEAHDEFSRKNYKLAVNRAYYSVFYIMRALLATINKDSSKHSGLLLLFNQHFIKTGIVSDVDFKSIKTLYDMRHEGDYQDFVEITEEECKGAIELAEKIISSVKKSLEQIMK